MVFILFSWQKVCPSKKCFLPMTERKTIRLLLLSVSKPYSFCLRKIWNHTGADIFNLF